MKKYLPIKKATKLQSKPPSKYLATRLMLSVVLLTANQTATGSYFHPIQQLTADSKEIFELERTTMKPSDFVSTYLPYALQTQDTTGINAAFTLAQAALESGWGKRAVGNMFFGIKAKPGTPEHQRQLVRTREVLSHANANFPEVISVKRLPNGKYEYIVKDWFRKYDTPEQSFTDHAKLYTTLSRYTNAMKHANDPYAFADAITSAGYATDPSYAKVLKDVVRTIEKHIP